MWNFNKWPSWFSSRSSRPMGFLFFVFLNMGPNRKKTSNISSESTQQIHSEKFMHTSREDLNQCCIKIGEISNSGFFANAISFSFLLTWDHMGEKKSSNNILPESTQEICSPKLSHTPRKGLCQSCMKNCEISFWIFWHFFFFFFFWGGGEVF